MDCTFPLRRQDRRHRRFRRASIGAAGAAAALPPEAHGTMRWLVVYITIYIYTYIHIDIQWDLMRFSGGQLGCLEDLDGCETTFNSL